MTDVLRMGRVLLGSRANGPGLRDVFWLQGCRISCPGCINPHLLPAGGTVVTVAGMADLLQRRAPSIDGITFSGGEPTEQAGAVAAVCRQAQALELSVTLFTGRTLRACRSEPAIRELLKYVDLLVAGPYRASRRGKSGPLLGSMNQRLHFLTGRYRPSSLADIPDQELLGGQTGWTLTGVPAPRIRGLEKAVDGQPPGRATG